MRVCGIALVMLAGCGGGGGGGAGGSAGGNDGGVDAAPLPDGGRVDAAPPLALQSVSGVLVFAEGTAGDPASTHLYSAEADGTNRRRVSREAGGWTFAAVGPDPQYVAAVRHGDSDGDGLPDAAGRRSVWLIDVPANTSRALTPEDCDAGIGGVGWRDETRIALSMRCGDEPAAAYLVNRDNVGRERENMLRISDHEQSVRDVFPAVGTPIFAYVVDARACQGRDCLVKPQIWVADHDAGEACRVTDGNPAMRQRDTVTGDEERLGDHQPAFNGDLTAIVFSRNVSGKPAGPEGHHDLFRVAVDIDALYRGDEACGGSVEALTGRFLDDAYGAPAMAGDERFPMPAAGRAPFGSIVLTARASGLSQVVVVDVDGTRSPVTARDRDAGYARWNVERYTIPAD